MTMYAWYTTCYGSYTLTIELTELCSWSLPRLTARWASAGRSWGQPAPIFLPEIIDAL
jgi:hypothetical protein